jgi:hypothetical protein
MKRTIARSAVKEASFSERERLQEVLLADTKEIENGLGFLNPLEDNKQSCVDCLAPDRGRDLMPRQFG